MGTDIHLEVERLGEDGLWHWIEHPDRPCDYELCTDGLYNEKTPNADVRGKPCFQCKGTGRYVDQFWDDRNYDVFAILADVRNGEGFAGVDTGDGFVPISTPKGLPADLSPELRRYADRVANEDWDDDYWGSGDDWKKLPDLGEHSMSWLTVREILDYDWTRTTKKRGTVGPGDFQLWREEGRPRGWSGGVSGGGVTHVTNAEMARLIDSGEIRFLDGEEDPFQGRRYAVGGEGSGRLSRSYYTTVEWEVTYEESARRFLQVLFRDIAPLGEPERVRLVFGFDS